MLEIEGHKLSPEFFEGLGRVTLTAAELEEALMAVVESAFAEPNGVRHQMKAHRLIREQRTPFLLSIIEKWYRLRVHTRRARALLKERNKVVHAIVESEFSWDKKRSRMGKPRPKMRSSRDFWWEDPDWDAPSPKYLKRLAARLAKEADWFVGFAASKAVTAREKRSKETARRPRIQEGQ